jgi:hypothetical protein
MHRDPLKEIAAWLERYRQFWTESFDRLDAYLRQQQTEGKTDERPQP